MYFSEKSKLAIKLNYIYIGIEQTLFLNESLWVICDALRNLVPFAQFKKHEITHGALLLSVKFAGFQAGNFNKINTPP